MLPVQTVMIRYMVLVYRWGSRWLGAVGAWEGFVGGAVTGGAVTGGAVTIGPGRARVRKGPADEGPAGPYSGKPYSVGSSGLGAGKGSGSKSSQPTGIVNTLPSATVIFSVLILY